MLKGRTVGVGAEAAPGVDELLDPHSVMRGEVPYRLLRHVHPGHHGDAAADLDCFLQPLLTAWRQHYLAGQVHVAEGGEALWQRLVAK